MSTLHEIAVRDPHHEHDATAQANAIAAWIRQHHPEMVVETWDDSFGRHHIAVRHHEHETSMRIRHDVSLRFPSVARLHPAPAVVAIVKPAKTKATTKKVVVAVAVKPAAPGFYVVEACKKTWMAKHRTVKVFGPYPGIRAAQTRLKALKASPGMHATIYHVGNAGHATRWIETWKMARTHWHKEA